MNKLAPILLVEDDPNDLELTLAALAENNLANNVVSVRDGEEALDYLYQRGKYAHRRPENPIVILLDLKMPKVDGLEVLKHIKKDEKLRLIPVVILTSSSMDQDLLESYKTGANAYVVKPVEFYNFIEAVKKVGVFWALINEPPRKVMKNQDK